MVSVSVNIGAVRDGGAFNTAVVKSTCQHGVEGLDEACGLSGRARSDRSRLRAVGELRRRLTLLEAPCGQATEGGSSNPRVAGTGQKFRLADSTIQLTTTTAATAAAAA